MRWVKPVHGRRWPARIGCLGRRSGGLPGPWLRRCRPSRHPPRCWASTRPALGGFVGTSNPTGGGCWSSRGRVASSTSPALKGCSGRSTGAPAPQSRAGWLPVARPGGRRCGWWPSTRRRPMPQRCWLPQAAVAVDQFHLVLAANPAVTKVRQRVTREHLGRRGRRTDPAWVNRRHLLRAGERSATSQLDSLRPATRPLR